MKQIDKPTLILTPKGGFSAQFEEAMHASIPNSELEEMEGVGHALFVDKAEAFNERVDRFITPRALPLQLASAHETPATPTATH